VEYLPFSNWQSATPSSSALLVRGTPINANDFGFNARTRLCFPTLLLPQLRLCFERRRVHFASFGFTESRSDEQRIHQARRRMGAQPQNRLRQSSMVNYE